MIWKLKWFEHQWVEQGAVQYKQWCVDAMNSVPGQFSLHSHIRTTLQKLCDSNILLLPCYCLLFHCLCVRGATVLFLSPNVSLLIAPFACLLRGLFIRRLPNLLIFIFFIRISFLFTVIIFFFFWCFCNNELMFVSSLT